MCLGCGGIGGLVFITAIKGIQIPGLQSPWIRQTFTILAPDILRSLAKSSKLQLFSWALFLNMLLSIRFPEKVPKSSMSRTCHRSVTEFWEAWYWSHEPRHQSGLRCSGALGSEPGSQASSVVAFYDLRTQQNYKLSGPISDILN